MASHGIGEGARHDGDGVSAIYYIFDVQLADIRQEKDRHASGRTEGPDGSRWFRY